MHFIGKSSDNSTSINYFLGINKILLELLLLFLTPKSLLLCSEGKRNFPHLVFSMDFQVDFAPNPCLLRLGWNLGAGWDQPRIPKRKFFGLEWGFLGCSLCHIFLLSWDFSAASVFCGLCWVQHIPKNLGYSLGTPCWSCTLAEFHVPEGFSTCHSFLINLLELWFFSPVFAWLGICGENPSLFSCGMGFCGSWGIGL